MIKRYLFAVSACVFALVACNEIEQPVQIEDDAITVSLSMVSADVLEDDEPFTRATGDETTFAILVSEFNTNTNNYEQYARGVFSSSNNISVRLKKNKKYSFQVALFKDFFSSGQQLNAYYNTDTTYTSANNKFVYDNMIFRQMHGGISSPYICNGRQYSTFYGETFYGKKTDYTATSTGTLEINLSRVSAFLEVIVNGMTEGKVSATDWGVNFDIVYPNNTYSSWITDAKYMYDSSFDQGLLLRYYDADNNETIIVQQSFVFKRNYKKTITINLNSSSQNNLSKGVSLNVSSTALQTDTPETIDCTI